MTTCPMIKGKPHYLWQAVDHGGHGLDSLVQNLCDKQAANWFFRKRLQDLLYVPRVKVTDKHKSDEAAK